ncbi:ribosomal RNA-processing protein 7 homolog A [Ambystoma mexicanum]|uniref:ribosomal RNA-processing protein 7 homolog A n=1 Tax=Ambystoma mexicanum TaxID=8296 RepID=UPI0037E75646
MAPPRKQQRENGDSGSTNAVQIQAPSGYTAVPVKFKEASRSCHYLYVKEHKVRQDLDPKRPQDRTLFITNIPPYCTQKCLLRLCSRYGPVQSVELQEKPGPAEATKVPESKFFLPQYIPGFQFAYVIFRNRAGVLSFRSSIHQEPLVMSKGQQELTGVHKWITAYSQSLTDPEELQAEVDSFMQEYDRKISEEEAKAEEEEGVPDEEGWVKVTRKGRRPGLPRTEAANIRVLEREKRRRAQKELLNFYSWQHRENKREHLAQLRRKFEEDKEKIAVMRAQRKFRPF